MSIEQWPDVTSRREMIRFFDGYSLDRMEELGERKLRRPLVKTQLLEFLGGGRVADSEALEVVFRRHAMRLQPMDDTLFRVHSDDIGAPVFLEQLTPRIVALYTTMQSQDVKRWVRRLVMGTGELDYVWLSGLTFGVLWKLVVRLSRPHRFSRLVFTHESVFDVDGLLPEEEEIAEESVDESIDEDVGPIIERRSTRFQLVDRVGVIEDKLQELQRIYSPLYAISQMRFPSPVGRGGHDFFHDGRVTNRAESFRDHRSHVLFVVRIYEQLLEATEREAWYSIKESVSVPGQFRKMVGAPVVIRFGVELKADVFDRWVQATFGRKRSRFRFWGHPLRLGPTKVHVYGIDQHLWQPIFLELTADGCTAIVPGGTCGNTVHRLVTNIQRFLDPGTRAFIGQKAYAAMVEESAKGVAYDHSAG
jgi:hypothetical protein